MIHFEFENVVSSHEKSTEKIISVKKWVGLKWPDFSIQTAGISCKQGIF